ITIDSGSLPTGLLFADNNDGTATIFGSPTSDGTSQVTLKATNGVGSDTQTFTIDASNGGGPPISFSGSNWNNFPSVPDTAGFQEGSSGEVDITSTNPAATITLLGNLPSGLSLSGSGASLKVTGTPDAGTSGNYGLEAKAVGSTGTSYQFL